MLVGVREMDFAAMKRRELQALCKRHGLPAGGTNAALVARLHAALPVSPNPSLPHAVQGPAGPGEEAAAGRKGCLKRSERNRDAKKVTFAVDRKQKHTVPLSPAAQVEVSRRVTRRSSIPGATVALSPAAQVEVSRRVTRRSSMPGATVALSPAAQVGVSRRVTRRLSMPGATVPLSPAAQVEVSRRVTRRSSMPGATVPLSPAAHVGVSRRVTRRSSLSGAAVLLPPAVEKKRGRRNATDVKDKELAAETQAAEEFATEASSVIVDSTRSKRKGEVCVPAVQRSPEVEESCRTTRSDVENKRRKTEYGHADGMAPTVLEVHRNDAPVTRSLRNRDVRVNTSVVEPAVSEMPRNDAPVTRSLRNRVVQISNNVAKQPAVKQHVRRSTRKSVVSVMLDKEENDLNAEKNPEAHVRRSMRKSIVPTVDIKAGEIQNGKAKDVEKQPAIKEPVRRSTRKSIVSAVNEEDKDLIAGKNPEAHVRKSMRKSVVMAKDIKSVGDSMPEAVEKQPVVSKPVRHSSRKSVLPDMFEKDCGLPVAEANAEAHARGSKRKSVTARMPDKESQYYRKMTGNQDFQSGKVVEEEQQLKVTEPVRRTRQSVARMVSEKETNGLHEKKLEIPTRRSIRKSVAHNADEKGGRDDAEILGREQPPVDIAQVIGSTTALLILEAKAPIDEGTTVNAETKQFDEEIASTISSCCGGNTLTVAKPQFAGQKDNQDTSTDASEPALLKSDSKQEFHSKVIADESIKDADLEKCLSKGNPLSTNLPSEVASDDCIFAALNVCSSNGGSSSFGLKCLVAEESNKSYSRNDEITVVEEGWGDEPSLCTPNFSVRSDSSLEDEDMQPLGCKYDVDKKLDVDQGIAQEEVVEVKSNDEHVDTITDPETKLNDEIVGLHMESDCCLAEKNTKLVADCPEGEEAMVLAQQSDIQEDTLKEPSLSATPESKYECVPEEAVPHSMKDKRCLSTAEQSPLGLQCPFSQERIDECMGYSSPSSATAHFENEDGKLKDCHVKCAEKSPVPEPVSCQQDNGTEGLLKARHEERVSSDPSDFSADADDMGVNNPEEVACNPLSTNLPSEVATDDCIFAALNVCSSNGGSSSFGLKCLVAEESNKSYSRNDEITVVEEGLGDEPTLCTPNFSVRSDSSLEDEDMQPLGCKYDVDKKLDVDQGIAQEEVVEVKSNDEHVDTITDPETKLNDEIVGLHVESDCCLAEKNTKLVADCSEGEEAMVLAQQSDIQEDTLEEPSLPAAPESKYECVPEEAVPQSMKDKRCLSTAEQSPLGLQCPFSQERIDECMRYGAPSSATAHFENEDGKLKDCHVKFAENSPVPEPVSCQQDNGTEGLLKARHEERVSSDPSDFSADANDMGVNNPEEVACKGEGNQKLVHSEDLNSPSEKSAISGSGFFGNPLSDLASPHCGSSSEEAVHRMKNYATCLANPKQLLMELQSPYSNENVKDSDSHDGLASPCPERGGDESTVCHVEQQVSVPLGFNLSQLESTHVLDVSVRCLDTEVLHQGHKHPCNKDKEKQVASTSCTSDMVDVATARYIESGVAPLLAEISNSKDGQLNIVLEGSEPVQSGLKRDKVVSNILDSGSAASIVGKRNPCGSSLPEDCSTDHYLEQEISDEFSMEKSPEGFAMFGDKSDHRLDNFPGTIQNPSFGLAIPDHKSEGPLCEEAAPKTKNFVGTCSSNPRELLMGLQSLFSEESIEESDRFSGLGFPSAETGGDESTVRRVEKCAQGDYMVISLQDNEQEENAHRRERDIIPEEVLREEKDKRKSMTASDSGIHQKSHSNGDDEKASCASETQFCSSQETTICEDLHFCPSSPHLHQVTSEICQSSGRKLIDGNNFIWSCDIEMVYLDPNNKRNEDTVTAGVPESHISGTASAPVEEAESVTIMPQVSGTSELPVEQLKPKLYSDELYSDDGEEHRFSCDKDRKEVFFTGSVTNNLLHLSEDCHIDSCQKQEVPNNLPVLTPEESTYYQDERVLGSGSCQTRGHKCIKESSTKQLTSNIGVLDQDNKECNENSEDQISLGIPASGMSDAAQIERPEGEIVQTPAAGTSALSDERLNSNLEGLTDSKFQA
ncbi:hypothetical protein ACP4OV_003168 [Aristida adscensionis]